jgi:hypothetical protein
MVSQIDKIQKMINNLLGLITEADAEVVSKESTGDFEDKYEDLGVMILRAHDDDLPARSMLEMQRLLTNDSQACCYYIDFQQVTAMLGGRFHPERLSVNLPCGIKS